MGCTDFLEFLLIRISSFRTILNLLIVFFATGLWHGAQWNFVVWGLFHGFFLILERIWLGKALEKCPKVLQHLYTRAQQLC